MNTLRRLALEGTAAVVVIVAMLSAPIARAEPVPQPATTSSQPATSQHSPEFDGRVRLIAAGAAIVAGAIIMAGFLAMPGVPILAGLSANAIHTVGLTALGLEVGGLYLLLSGEPGSAIPGNNGSRNSPTRGGSVTATESPAVSGAVGAGMPRD